MFEMDALEAWDIDEEADFAFAEALMQVRNASKSPKRRER
jgi:CMP-N-acetylneuraminic acid synthetase